MQSCNEEESNHGSWVDPGTIENHDHKKIKQRNIVLCQNMDEILKLRCIEKE